MRDRVIQTLLHIPLSVHMHMCFVLTGMPTNYMPALKHTLQWNVTRTTDPDSVSSIF